MTTNQRPSLVICIKTNSLDYYHIVPRLSELTSNLANVEITETKQDNNSVVTLCNITSENLESLYNSFFLRYVGSDDIISFDIVNCSYLKNIYERDFKARTAKITTKPREKGYLTVTYSKLTPATLSTNKKDPYIKTTYISSKPDDVDITTNDATSENTSEEIDLN